MSIDNTSNPFQRNDIRRSHLWNRRLFQRCDLGSNRSSLVIQHCDSRLQFGNSRVARYHLLIPQICVPDINLTRLGFAF